MRGERVRAGMGGMVETPVPESGVATLALNVAHDPEGYWLETPGTFEVTEEAPGSGAIRSVVWFNPRPNARWLVFEQGTSLVSSSIRYQDFVTGASVAITARRRLSSADAGTLFVQNGRWLYMFSSVDAPVRWNGYYTDPVGFVTPAPQPIVAGYDQNYTAMDRAGGDMSVPSFRHQTQQRGVGPFPSTAGTDSFWRYGYQLTMVNELGQESPPSAMVFASGKNGIAAAEGLRMVRMKIPPLPDNVRGFKLYRTQNLIGVADTGAQAQTYFLEQFATGWGGDYTDQASDAELGEAFDPDSVGPVPLGASAAAFWTGSLWLGGMQTSPTRLFYSSPLFPEQFPVVNYLEIGTTQTGAIVALLQIQRALIVFKQGGVYLVKGDHVSGFTVSSLSETIGCAAPRSIVQIPDVGVAFLSSSGPMMIKGSLNDDQVTTVEAIRGIRRTWRRYSGNLAQAVAVHIPEYNEVWWQIPKGGDLRPSLGLVYHLDLDQWSLRTGFRIGCFTRHLGKTWVGSWDDDNFPGCYLLTYASTSWFGANSPHAYQAFFTFDEARTPMGVEVWALALGNAAVVSVTLQPDRATAIPETTAGKTPQANRVDLEVWGVAAWGASKLWADAVPTRLQIGARMAQGRELGVTLSASKLRWFGLALVLGDNVSPTPERSAPQ